MQIVDDAGKVLLGFLGLLSVHDGKVLHELAECARWESSSRACCVCTMGKFFTSLRCVHDGKVLHELATVDTGFVEFLEFRRVLRIRYEFTNAAFLPCSARSLLPRYERGSGECRQQQQQQRTRTSSGHQPSSPAAQRTRPKLTAAQCNALHAQSACTL
jgi:hypothetical protein